MIQALDKETYHPIVLFLHDSEAVSLYKKNGIQIIEPIGRMDFPHTKIWWLRWYHCFTIIKAIKDTVITMFITAPKIINDVQPKIVHLNTSSLIAWGIASSRAKIPVVWHIREPLADGYFGLRKWIISKCVARYATTILPISYHDAQPWKNNKKTQIIYNAATTTFFDANINPLLFIAKNRLNQQKKRILFLGGLSEEKGATLICTIFSHIIKKIPNAQLLIAGAECPNMLNASQSIFFKKNRVNKLIANIVLNLPRSTIHFLGTIHQIPEAMAASNIIVFPAIVGHNARPIIEAGFMKKPVVASDLSPLDELVIHNKTGYLIDPNNVQAWINILCDLLTNQTLCQQIGEQGYNFCTSKFNIETQKTNVQNVYTAILGKSNEPRI